MSTGWNENMLKKLKSLVGKGLSTSEMGKKLGMSKNAVVGKLNRLGWNAKATEKTPKKADKKKEVAKKTAVKKTETKSVKKTAEKPVKKAETTKKVAKKTTTSTKTVVKKATPVKKTATKKVEKTAPKKEVKKAVKPVAESKTKTKTEKEPVVAEKPVIKTASKKTKKDLALHELLIQHALQMANLKTNQCRWPIGDPDSDNFHFCGEQVFAGKPYCYEHCRQAYQFTPPKKK